MNTQTKICYKEKFATEPMAEYEIKKRAERNLSKGLVFRSYLCPRCSTWHLTTHRKIDTVEDENIKLKHRVEKQQEIINLQNTRIQELKKEFNTTVANYKTQVAELKKEHQLEKKKQQEDSAEKIIALKAKLSAPKPKKPKKQKPNKVKNFVYKSIIK